MRKHRGRYIAPVSAVCAGHEHIKQDAAQRMALTTSMTMCDCLSSEQNAMLCSGAAVDTSHACCFLLIGVKNTTLTAAPYLSSSCLVKGVLCKAVHV